MINPDAVATGGTCHDCGKPIKVWFVVLLCDDCMGKKTSMQPDVCATCQAPADHDPAECAQ